MSLMFSYRQIATDERLCRARRARFAARLLMPVTAVLIVASFQMEPGLRPALVEGAARVASSLASGEIAPTRAAANVAAQKSPAAQAAELDLADLEPAAFPASDHRPRDRVKVNRFGNSGL